jgi:hypothetical protein
VGWFKAAFFRRLCYSTENWEVFEQHLGDLILSQDVTRIEESRYGQKFIVLILEGFDFRAQDEMTALNNPVDSGIDLILYRVVLSL